MNGILLSNDIFSRLNSIYKNYRRFCANFALDTKRKSTWNVECNKSRSKDNYFRTPYNLIWNAWRHATGLVLCHTLFLKKKSEYYQFVSIDWVITIQNIHVRKFKLKQSKSYKLVNLDWKTIQFVHDLQSQMFAL